MKTSKKIFLYMLSASLLLSGFSCTAYRTTAGKSGKVPPGQAKKIYGHKSARDFAPGHNK